jgi:hypothetical protein
MSLKSKAKAAKRREQNRKQQEIDAASVVANAERLRAMTSGFARTPRSVAQEQAFAQSKMPKYRVDSREVQHVEKRFVAPEPQPRPYLSAEMAAREEAAQERYREMKSLVQPLYNKGGPQYPDASAIEAARKGELRRRS